MAVSKVILNGDTLIDATTATATAEDILSPKTAIIASGEMAVGAIETGGGGYTADDIATNTEPSGHIELSDSVHTIAANAFSYKPITTIHAPEVTSIAVSAFSYSGLTVLDDNSFPKYTRNDKACFNNSSLQTIKNTKLTWLQTGVFNSCTLLETACLPNVTAINGGAGFRYCTAITLLDCKVTGFSGYELQNAANLTTMILRKTGAVCSLANTTNCLQNTPVQGKDGKTCTVYVPSDLVETYKTDTNWSYWYGLGYVSFVALEGSQYESITWWED